MATNQAIKSVSDYNVIMSSDLEHYMTLDEMHQRLVRTIRNHFAFQISVLPTGEEVISVEDAKHSLLFHD